MNRLLSVLAIAAAASLFLAAAPETPSPQAEPVNLRVEISPAYTGPYELLREQRPDTYTCTANLFDEPSHRLYGGVLVIVRPGQEQTTTATADGLTMTMKGRVDAGRTGAVADVTILRDGNLIAHQMSRVNLMRPGRQRIY